MNHSAKMILVSFSIFLVIFVFTRLRADNQSTKFATSAAWESLVDSANIKGGAEVIPVKDQMSVKDFWQIENQSEESLDKVRVPAQKIAQALLR